MNGPYRENAQGLAGHIFNEPLGEDVSCVKCGGRFADVYLERSCPADSKAREVTAGVFTTDCRSQEGITVSLLDGIMATCRVLRTRDLQHPAAVAALHDLAQDRDVHAVFGIGRIYLFDRRDELLAKVHRTREEDARLQQLREEIAALPTARNADDQAAMDFIREAADLLRQKGLGGTLSHTEE